MSWYLIAIILLSLGILIFCAHQVIKRTIRLARHFCLTEFVVSFLFIGIAAIMPELLVGIVSALEGNSSFGLAIIFGSNIADLTLILGIVVLAASSLKLQSSTIHEISLLFLFVALPVIFLIDGSISRIDGLILIAAFIVYLFLMLRWGKAQKQEFAKKLEKITVWKELVNLFIALAGLLIAGHLITNSANGLSALIGLPIFLIGTLIAVATCLPELTVSIEAARKKHAELGFGDVLGNVFADCMLAVGIIALINPIQPEQPLMALLTGIIMIFAMVLLVLLFHLKKQITKKYGIALIAVYLFFIFILFWVETNIFL